MAARWVVPWVSSRAAPMVFSCGARSSARLRQQHFRKLFLGESFLARHVMSFGGSGSKKGDRLKIVASSSTSSPSLKSALPLSDRLEWISRSHLCGQLSEANEGERVRLCGWVASQRSHGNLTFVNLRDHTGIVQVHFTL